MAGAGRGRGELTARSSLSATARLRGVKAGRGSGGPKWFPTGVRRGGAGLSSRGRRAVDATRHPTADAFSCAMSPCNTGLSASRSKYLEATVLELRGFEKR